VSCTQRAYGKKSLGKSGIDGRIIWNCEISGLQGDDRQKANEVWKVKPWYFGACIFGYRRSLLTPSSG
jgi:hypothetical protein